MSSENPQNGKPTRPPAIVACAILVGIALIPAAEFIGPSRFQLVDDFIKHPVVDGCQPG